MTHTPDKTLEAKMTPSENQRALEAIEFVCWMPVSALPPPPTDKTTDRGDGCPDCNPRCAACYGDPS